MPDYAVGTRFTAREQVTQSLNRMTQAADRFGRRTSSAFRNATKHGYKFGTIVKGILAADIIRGGVGMLEGGLGSLGKSFAEFDDTMIGATARFNDIGAAATDFDRRVQSLKTGTRAAIAGTKFTAVEAAEVMNEFAKADFESAAALGALRSQLQLATAADTEFRESIMISNRLLGAFGLRSEDSAKQIANHVRLNNMLGAAANMANGDLTTLFETMKTAAPVGGIIGTTPEEIMGMAVAIDKAGIDASMAATSIKNAILNIGSADVQKELEANGIQVVDKATGKFRKFTAILRDMNIKFKQLDLGKTPELTQIVNRLFGKYGLGGILGLMNNIDTADQVTEKLRKVDEANRLMEERLKKGLGYRIAALKQQLMELGFRILDTFEYKGKRGIEALTEAVRNFNPMPLIDGLNATVDVLEKIWWVVKSLGQPLLYLTAGFLIFNGVLKALVIGQTALLFYRLAKSMYVALGAWQALNLLFLSNPLGLIALGVTAVILGLIWLEKKFGIVSKTAKAFWEILKGIWNAMKGLAGVFFGGFKTPEFNVPQWNFGGGQSPAEPPAPNTKEAEARRIQLNGRLQIAGAPAGSTLEQKNQGAPGFRWDLLGANP